VSLTETKKQHVSNRGLENKKEGEQLAKLLEVCSCPIPPDPQISDQHDAQIFKNLYDEITNPNGLISIGVAENSLMSQEITEFLNEKVAIYYHFRQNMLISLGENLAILFNLHRGTWRYTPPSYKSEQFGQ